jgi:hypothetical protein
MLGNLFALKSARVSIENPCDAWVVALYRL